MISVFDIYELLPHTDCGKCTAGSCMNMAKKLSQNTANINECSVIAANPEAYGELESLIKSEEQ